MEKNHAILSASSSARWLACTPSARLELEFEDYESVVAKEGTAAHALAEHKLKRKLNPILQKKEANEAEKSWEWLQPWITMKW